MKEKKLKQINPKLYDHFILKLYENQKGLNNAKKYEMLIFTQNLFKYFINGFNTNLSKELLKKYSKLVPEYNKIYQTILITDYDMNLRNEDSKKFKNDCIIYLSSSVLELLKKYKIDINVMMLMHLDEAIDIYKELSKSFFKKDYYNKQNHWVDYYITQEVIKEIFIEQVNQKMVDDIQSPSLEYFKLKVYSFEKYDENIKKYLKNLDEKQLQIEILIRQEIFLAYLEDEIFKNNKFKMKLFYDLYTTNLSNEILYFKAEELKKEYNLN